MDRELRAKLSPAVFEAVLAAVPDAWLVPETGAILPAEKRQAYVEYLMRRLDAADVFVEEAVRAHAQLV